MVQFIVSSLTALSLVLSPATQDIERAFLQNNPKLLYQWLSTATHINISLPEPIFFSDQISHQQAYFVFKKIFSSYSTFEFYSEHQSLLPENQKYIYKARWSFLDKKTNDQHLFHIFFLLAQENSGEHNLSKVRWKITEIKAKKI